MDLQTMELDLDERDPNDLNQHVRSLFEDVIGEPDGTHSTECVWKVSHECYTFCKACWYNVMAVFCGACIAIFWGCEFALLAFRHVFCVTPFARSCSITFGTWQQCWGMFLFCLVAPVCDSCGSVWSQIRIATAEFHDVFGEPDGIRSINCVWKASFFCFECGKHCCYKLLTLFCGIFLALCWGCEFGVTAFQHIWSCTPSLRMYSIWCGICQKFFGTTINCFLVPLCESCGMCFSQIRVRKGSL